MGSRFWKLKVFSRTLFFLFYSLFASERLVASIKVNTVLVPTDATVNVCKGTLVSFTYGSSGTPQVSWEFEGITPPFRTGLSVSITYTNNGLFKVKQTVGTGSSAVSDSIYVRVDDTKPVADFDFDPKNMCSNVPVHFINHSTGSGLSFLWSFGDLGSGPTNNSSTLTNPVHQFVGTLGNANQPFNVTLTVTNSSGCTATRLQTVTTKRLPDTLLNGPGSFIDADDGKHYFTVCTGEDSAVFNFSNLSSTASTDSFYKIVWGDGRPDTVLNSFSGIVAHKYGNGYYKMLFVATNKINACADTGVYYPYLGKSPALGFKTDSLGIPRTCTGESIKFLIEGTQLNPADTKYTLSFYDGTPDTTFNHPAPDFIWHTFDSTSCGRTTLGVANSFAATIVAKNPCGRPPTEISIKPILVSDKPKAVFKISPKDTVCVGTRITLTDTSKSLNAGDGSCLGKAVWKISGRCGIDWTITGGCPASNTTVGNDFNSPNPSDWLRGLNVLDITFLQPGTYDIKLKTGGWNRCGIDSLVKRVCVDSVPRASFVSIDSGCAPLAITPSTTTNAPFCGNYKYRWTVANYSNPSVCLPSGRNYRYINGTDSTFREPTIEFINPGDYSWRLEVTSPGGTCSTAVAPKLIRVKGKPNISFKLSTLPDSICQNACINPEANYSCYVNADTTYKWKFPGAAPDSSLLSKPPAICYPALGSFDISLTAANVCGSDTIAKKIKVNPPPAFTAPNDTVVCAGTQICYDLRTPGISFTWSVTSSTAVTPSSGATGLICFTPNNGSNPPVIATVTITATQNGCSVQKRFTVTIKPRPAKPVVCARPVSYCFGATPDSLCAKASPKNTLLGCTAYPQGCSASPFYPRTDTASTICYVVYQVNDTSGCASDTAKICVTVTPKISNNVILGDTALCAACAPPGTLRPAGLPTGGNGSGTYSYQWQHSTDGGTSWSNVVPPSSGTNASYSPASVCSTTLFRRIVRSGGCSDTSNAVTVSVGSLPPPTIDTSQHICAGDTPALLTGPSGNASYVYSWQRSASALGPWDSIPGAHSQNYQPPPLTATAYYRRKDSSGGCSAYSNVDTITVYNKPVAGGIAPADTTVCTGGSVIIRSNTTDSVLLWERSPLPVTNTSWLPASPPFTGIVQSFALRLIVVTRGYGRGCNLSDTSNAAVVRVSPKSVGGNTDADDTVCSGANGDTIRLSNYTGQIVRWDSSGNNGTSWNAVANTSPALIYTDLNTTTWYRAVVKSGACPEAFSDTTVITVVRSVTPANAGRDTALCNVPAVALNGNQPAIGIGQWSQVSPSSPKAAFTDSSLYNTTVTGLQPNNAYVFAWTIRGGSLCSGSVSTVRIRIWPPATVADAGPDTLKVCDFPFTRSVQLSANRGRVFETMRWSLVSGPPGTAFGDTGNPSSGFTFNNTGTYKLKWRISNDSTNGCPATEDFLTIMVLEKPVAGPIVPAQASVCTGDSVRLSTTPVRGVIQKWQYRIPPSAQWNDTLIAASSVTFQNVQSSFAVRALVEMPGTAPACNLVDSAAPAFVTVNAVPPAAIKVSPDSVQEQPNTTFHFSVTSADSSRYRYLWNMGDRSGQTRAGRDITYTYNDTGTFTVKLTVTNILSSDCKGSATVKVKIIPVPGYLYVPDAICIRCNDARLREFLPLGRGLAHYRLRIYSKWGKLLFETSKLNPDGSPAEAWKAEFVNPDRSTTELQQDAFMWAIEATFINGAGWKGMIYPDNPGRYVKSHFITVIR